MIDDHNRCEWVNALLVPAHPGFSGQSPESRKMVVVVSARSHYTHGRADRCVDCVNNLVKDATNSHPTI